MNSLFRHSQFAFRKSVSFGEPILRPHSLVYQTILSRRICRSKTICEGGQGAGTEGKSQTQTLQAHALLHFIHAAEETDKCDERRPGRRESLSTKIWLARISSRFWPF